MTTLNDTSPNTSARNAQATADNIHRGIDRATEALHSTAENAVASAGRLAESADRGLNQLRATQEQAREGVLSYSQEHPLRALAIGFGVGFVLAKLTARRVH